MNRWASVGRLALAGVDQAMDVMEQKALPESIRWIREQKRVADKYGLKLLAYEGGQHKVVAAGVENNDAITGPGPEAEDYLGLQQPPDRLWAWWDVQRLSFAGRMD